MKTLLTILLFFSATVYGQDTIRIKLAKVDMSNFYTKPQVDSLTKDYTNLDPFLNYDSTTNTLGVNVSNDSTGASKDAAKLITEKASKDYVDYQVKVYRGYTDGVTDNYVKLQQFINANVGRQITVPKGNYYVSNTLYLPEGTNIIGNNAKIFNTIADTLIIINGSNILIDGIELQGIGNDTISFENVGIFHQTIDHADSNIVIRNCYIHDMGNFGIYLVNLKDSKVDGVRIFNVGYTGIGIFSSDNTNVLNSVVKYVTPNAANTAYGISYSVRLILEDTTFLSYPKNSSIVGNTVIGVPWHGIDGHSGQNLKIQGNNIDSCGTGIYLTAFTYYPGDGSAIDTILFPIKNTDVVGNTVNGRGLGNGVSLFNSDPNTAAQNIKIIGNTILNAGINGQAIAGAISVYRTKNTIINNNILINSITNAINVGITDTLASVINNSITNVFGTSLTSGILITDSLSTGIISGNTITADSTGASHSNEYGIRAINSNNRFSISNNYVSSKVATNYSLNSVNTGVSIASIFGTTGYYPMFNGNVLTDGSLQQSGSAVTFGAGGSRPIIFNYGSGLIAIQGGAGGWQNGYTFYSNNGSTNFGGLWGNGAANSFTAWFLGSSLSQYGLAVYPSTYTIPNLVKLNGPTQATGFSTAYVSKTANYTATVNDYTIDCNGTFTVTLPTSVGIAGREYVITNSGSGTITIATTSSETFKNVSATPTTLTLSTVGSYKVQATGANWIVISKL